MEGVRGERRGILPNRKRRGGEGGGRGRGGDEGGVESYIIYPFISTFQLIYNDSSIANKTRKHSPTNNISPKRHDPPKEEK